MNKVLVFIGLCSLLTGSFVAAGPECIRCNGARDSEETCTTQPDNVAQCGDHEVCTTDVHRDQHGRLFYRKGCERREVCSAFNQVICDEERDHCHCHCDTGDLCNLHAPPEIWDRLVSHRPLEPCGSKLASEADSHVGSQKWALHTPGGAPDNWYSHEFVADVLKEVGGNVPQQWWWWSPIAAAEWGNKNSEYLREDECWHHVTHGNRVGDVASDGARVAIVTGDNIATLSMHHAIFKGDWEQCNLERNKLVFWRYVCHCHK